MMAEQLTALAVVTSDAVSLPRYQVAARSSSVLAKSPSPACFP